MTLADRTGPGTSTARGPGRPRNGNIDEQILTATQELIDENEPITVNRIVQRSGVSRAALYLRWPSVTALVAAAVDAGRQRPEPLPTGADPRETILGAFLGAAGSEHPVGYPEERFRQRIRLAMENPELQKTYWASHVSRRRAPVEVALRDAIACGVLRDDLDVEACFDLLAGVLYYQLVVRGDRLADEAVHARCRRALDVAWRGMLAG
ncbi:MAG: TetR/AcrR family transcriptional regulator C-terminal ligand-binding domain-containing protein [Rhodococcus sp. (in: high G+C Gram-positive bacteria)]|uniref:TetR/AcrR family transcriptional regulator n=1 Tax=Rhodococcus sp. TaxID=1831 RepID=UPI003BB758C6